MENQCDDKEECCREQSACCQSAGDGCCDLPGRLLQIADEAWYELLKEKIKKEIESTSGDKLDKLAKLVAEANGKKWAHEMSGKAMCEEYRNNLKQLFSSCECSD